MERRKRPRERCRIFQTRNRPTKCTACTSGRWYYFVPPTDLSDRKTSRRATGLVGYQHLAQNGESVAEETWKTDAEGKSAITSDLPAGASAPSSESRDRFGKGVGKMLQSYWTDTQHTQHVIRVPVSESMRGGFLLRVTYVRENRAYLSQMHVDVPWSNKHLDVKWERFVSKLQPGVKETWTAIVTGPDAEKATAEMVAGLYDASLDAFLPHQWLQRLEVFRTEQVRLNLRFENDLKTLQYYHFGWQVPYVDEQLSYRHLPPDIAYSMQMYFGGGGGRGAGGRMAPMAARALGDEAGNADRMEAKDGDVLQNFSAGAELEKAKEPSALGVHLLRNLLST